MIKINNNCKTFLNTYNHMNLGRKTKRKKIYLILMKAVDDHLMKKVEKILIQTNKREQITGAYVRAVMLKIKRLQLWMTINLKVSPCKLFN